MHNRETILIIDFGSQFTKLITRRIREANVYSEIYPHTISIDKIKEIKPKGIIFSGGPLSVYDEGAPEIDKEILSLKIPVLGICYGLQLICINFGGKVEPAADREYGKAVLRTLDDSDILSGINDASVVWMSHGYYLSEIPPGFKVIG